MVRRGSPVRVRKRASKRPANGLFCCRVGIRPVLDPPVTCPRNFVAADISQGYRRQAAQPKRRADPRHRRCRLGMSAVDLSGMNASAPRGVLGRVIGALVGLALGLAFGRVALAVALGAAAGAMLIGVFELAKKQSGDDEADHDKRGTSVGIGIAIGAGVGTAFGVIFGDIAIGAAFGAGLGVVAGSIFDLSG